MNPIQTIARVLDEAHYVRAVARSGLIAVEPPHRTVGAAASVLRYGTIGGVAGVAAARHGNRAAIIDELGSITYRELDRNSNALANAWLTGGFVPGKGIAILARNHRGLLVSVFAAAKCGAKIVLLNTDFAAPQLREVVAREGVDLLVHDDEYAEILVGIDPPHGRWRAWAEAAGTDTIDFLIASSSTASPPRSRVIPKIILLTSGTTGTPKGAPRPEPRSLQPVGTLLDRVPMRAKGVTAIPAPMFHTLGFAHMILAVGMGSTILTRRRFDPPLMIDAMETHRATGLVAVPVMLARVVEHLEQFGSQRPLPSLEWAFVAGSQLGADLAKRSAAVLGPVVHNMYGSTEVAYATIATPRDLAAAPSTVGKPVRGAVVRVLDDQGRPVPTGTTGRIFVGNSVQFEGYTGGGHKEIVRGLMASGDVGHFDENGRLFIDGRDDDMIVSGGENVFPGEVEELLAEHPQIREVSCVGVEDEKFGQRIRAFVVLTGNASLGEDEIRDYVKGNLARYKAPRDIVFLDRLPRNPTGKVLKRELRSPSVTAKGHHS